MANLATGAGAYINGSDVLVFCGGKAIAYSTNSQISLSADATDVSHKDWGSGWNSSVITSRSWEMTTDALLAEDVLGEGEYTFSMLFDAYSNGTQLDVVFGLTPNAGAATRHPNIQDAENGGEWSFDTHDSYQGKAIVTSLSASGDVGGNATFSVTLTGIGAITKVAKSA